MKSVCPSLGKERLVCIAFSQGRIISQVGSAAATRSLQQHSSRLQCTLPRLNHRCGTRRSVPQLPWGGDWSPVCFSKSSSSHPLPKELQDRGLCRAAVLQLSQPVQRKDQAHATKWKVAACILQQQSRGWQWQGEPVAGWEPACSPEAGPGLGHRVAPHPQVLHGSPTLILSHVEGLWPCRVWSPGGGRFSALLQPPPHPSCFLCLCWAGG